MRWLKIPQIVLNIDGRVWILAALIVVLLFGVREGVLLLIDLAEQIGDPKPGEGMGEFAQGMVLTAVTGVLTSLLAALTLLVKALVDLKVSRKPGKRNEDNNGD